MTALTAFWAWGEEAGARQRCERMLAACSGYGSGRSIVRQSGSIVIGRRLTPLLPEDAHDAGPVAGADGSLLAADIRIDNRAELLRELGLAAAQGERLTDTALLMRCWERWREAMLDRVTGDYAFLLWDGPGQRLLLARDPMGQRPLCFHRAHGFVAVASMPRGLHALAEIPYALDEDALRTFLEYGEPDSSGTFFTGVKQVPPGHFLEIRPDRIDSRAFWSPDLTPIRYLRDEDYVERGRELLDAAVASRLRGAGHRVGAHLSAGLDSAGVAATAARLMNGQGALFGFTAVPPPGYPRIAKNGRLLDEGPGAAATASMYPNLEHVLVPSTTPSPLADLERGFQLFQRPLPNPCNQGWAGSIQDEARARGVSVLLSGQMGNLTFSHSGLDLLPASLRRGRLLAAGRAIAALRRRGMPAGELATSTLGPLLPAGLWRALQRLRGRPHRQADFTLTSRGSAIDYASQPEILDARARLRVLSRFDFGNFNKGVLAGWGIDMRDPTADRRLVEYCLRVPADQFLHEGVRRSLARRMLADRLPAQIVQSHARGYQGADWKDALARARGEVEAEVQRISASGAAGRQMDLERFRSLLEEWPADLDTPDAERLYRSMLLRTVSAGHFARKVEGSNA